MKYNAIDTTMIQVINVIFQMLKKNNQLLKYKYHVFRWNPNIDNKFLNQQHKICVDRENDEWT